MNNTSKEKRKPKKLNANVVYVLNDKDILKFTSGIANILLNLAGKTLPGKTETEKLLPRNEIIKMLNIGKSTFARWVKAGKIKTVKRGGRSFYKQEDYYRLKAELDAREMQRQ